jgi:hypothetical protein
MELRFISYQSQGVQSVGAALGLEHHAELVQLGDLILCEVAGVAILLLRALDREIIAVVLGVQIHGDRWWGRRWNIREEGKKVERVRSVETAGLKN